MFYRWLVFWYDGREGADRVSIVDDDCDAPKMPYGVDTNVISDDCDSIHGAVLMADAPHVPHVALGDAEINWPPEAATVPTEFRVIHSGDGGIETDADDEEARQERGNGDEAHDASNEA